MSRVHLDIERRADAAIEAENIADSQRRRQRKVDEIRREEQEAQIRAATKARNADACADVEKHMATFVSKVCDTQNALATFGATFKEAIAAVRAADAAAKTIDRLEHFDAQGAIDTTRRYITSEMSAPAIGVLVGYTDPSLDSAAIARTFEADLRREVAALFRRKWGSAA